MAISKIWVFAEAINGEVAPITLEMLAKAREIADTVEVFTGGDGNELAAAVGAHGATTVHATGSLDDGLPGVHVAAAVAAAVGSAAPDAIFLGTTQDGRDVAGHHQRDQPRRA